MAWHRDSFETELELEYSNQNGRMDGHTFDPEKLNDFNNSLSIIITCICVIINATRTATTNYVLIKTTKLIFFYKHAIFSDEPGRAYVLSNVLIFATMSFNK